VGKRADLVAWNVKQPAELCYWIGGGLARQVWIGGVAMPARA
jgi:imidazolonepropionase